ncbi:hypothetical protein GCM10009848_42490 [Micromonospora lupini]
MVDEDWWSILRALDEPVAPVKDGIGRESILRAMVEGVMPPAVSAALNERLSREVRATVWRCHGTSTPPRPRAGSPGSQSG